jgi:hypothetical protein
MTDITVSSTDYLPADRPWLLFEAVGHQAPTSTDFGVINFALFDQDTHYPDGFIPSGVALARVTTGGALGPYDNSAGDGRGSPVGFLYNAIAVPADTARKVAVALVDCFAVISESRLPAGHGLDAAGKLELPLIQFRA